MADELSTRDGLDLYETGKHRRYNLLFSVNGGAFAIAKLLVDDPTQAVVVLGGLTLSRLSLGMILFTVVMVIDIFMFGSKMRSVLDRPGGPEVFGTPGKIVLVLLGLLISMGWYLVGFSGTPLA
jgi:hypothetical protein